MKAIIFLFVVFAALSLGSTYSKYGRTCGDIGCVYNEKCVMREDPCTRASRAKGCGSYPACERVNNNPETCDTFVCPPTQRCQLTNGAPKCVAKVPSGRHKRLVQNYNYGSSSNYAPSAPPSPVDSNYPTYPINSNSQYPRLYPVLPPVQPSGHTPYNYGQTPYNYGQTPRPLNYQNSNNYNPYQTTMRPNYGNQIRPVYPAYNQSQNNYYNTRNQNEYPTQRYPGYPTQPPYYSNQRYPNQPYPTQRPVYPTQQYQNPNQNNQRYPNQGYPNQGYPNSNYPPYQQSPLSPSGRNYPAQQNYYNNMYQTPNNDQESNTIWVASSSKRTVRQTYNSNYPSTGATYPNTNYNQNQHYNQQPYNPQYPNQNHLNNPNQLYNHSQPGLYPSLPNIGQTNPPNYYQGSSVGGIHQGNQPPYNQGHVGVGGVHQGNQPPYNQGQVGVGGVHQGNQPPYNQGHVGVGGVHQGNQPPYNQGHVGVGGVHQGNQPPYNQGHVGGIVQPPYNQGGIHQPTTGNNAANTDFYVAQTQGNRQQGGTGGATYPNQGIQGQRYPIQPGYQGGNYQRTH